MRFRYTLQHTPAQERDIDELSQWLTRSTGANPDWTEADQPSVIIPSNSGNVGDPITSEIIYTNYPFIAGNQYTIEVEFSKVLNTGSTTNPRTLFLEIYNNSFVAQFTTNVVTSVSSGQTISLTFTATSSCTKVGVYATDNSNVTITLTGRTFTPPTHATTTQEISEPDGWEGSKIKLERDYDFQSLIEHYVGAANGGFIFYGENDEVNGGLNFIKDIEQEFGFDANIEITSEFAPDDEQYQEIFHGLLELSGKNEMPDNLMQIPVIRDDFWAKFMARKETPVNLSDNIDIDGQAVDPVDPVTILLTDQYINQYFVGFLPQATYSFVGGIAGNNYIQLDFDDKHVFLSEAQKNVTIDEIDTHISGYPIIDNPKQPDPAFDFEFPGDIIINDLTLIVRNATSDTTTHLDADIKAYLYDGTTEHLLTRTDYLGSDGITRRTRFVYSGTITDAKSIAVYLYNDSGSTSGDIGLLFDDQVEIGVPPTYTTKFDYHLVSKYPDTEAQGYLIHDLIHGVLARIGLGDNPFYSELLGATFTNALQYDEDGCGSGYVILKGLQIRQYSLSDKPFATSFQQIWDGLNKILNLGLGYEIIDDSPDRQVIRIEEKGYFLSDSVSINFSNVRQIESGYDQDYIFKLIKTGYKKWQSEETQGIDDFAKHTRTTKIMDGREFNIESELIASPLVIETTRRTKKNKNKDFKYDNENFIVTINTDDISPDVYYPELDEHFDSISGLLNSNRRYNLVLSPTRNFLRWAPFFGGCLQAYPTEIYKFVPGEGNYDFTTDYSCALGNQCQGIICDPIKERSNISLADYNSLFGYYHLAQLCTMTIPMEWEEYETIRDNRNESIGISQTESGHAPMKIKMVEYDMVKGEALIMAWPKTFFNVQVIEQEMPESGCDGEADPGGFAECYQDVLDYGETI